MKNKNRKNLLPDQCDVLSSGGDKKHNKWASKFKKTKQGKLFDMVYDVRSLEMLLKKYDKLTFLASALSIATKGTKMEEDANELIRIICPKLMTKKVDGNFVIRVKGNGQDNCH